MLKNRDDVERCDCTVIHQDIVDWVKDKMPDEDVLIDLSELFKIFGDSTRVKILWALYESEMCVCDISALLNMSQSAISHQLRILKQTDLVKSRRAGRVVFYSLKDEHVKRIIDQGLAHITEDK